MNFHTPPDYLAQAEKCMEWAERASDRETELHWLSMAQAYLALAAALEKEVPHPVWGDASLLEFNRSISPTRH
jgi:hypothetical protein